MDIRRLNFETTIFVLALVLALALRLFNLGAAPLSDSEAEWALQAYQVANPEQFDEPLVLGPQPAYVFLTGLTFTLFNANTFLARIWPALAGSLLVLLPLCFRRELGREAAVILAFGLALDPGLVAVSRLAGSPAMAVGFGLLAVGLWRTRSYVLSSVLAGVALLSGPAMVAGALGLGLTWLITRFPGRSHPPDSTQDETISSDSSNTENENSSVFRDHQAAQRQALLIAAATILVLGTYLFRYPQGLAAWFLTIPAYLDTWITPSGVPILRSVAALVIYQPFALILALVGLARWLVNFSLGVASKNETLKIVWPWFLIALALALLPPGRQVTHLSWALVPLWTLAAMELSAYLPEGKINPIAIAQALIVLVLAGLFWNTLVATSQVITVPGVPMDSLRLAILVGILSLGALTTALIALGWSWEASRSGLAWGLTAAFGIYLIAVLWGVTQLRPNSPAELWAPAPATDQAALFTKTVQDLSEWNTGFGENIDIVSQVNTPSIRWALREFPNLRFVSEPSMSDLPSIIITSQDQQVPALTASYRGQDFSWWLHPAWPGALPPDAIKWFTFREAPLIKEQIILWARSDLFPGGILEAQEAQSDEPEIERDLFTTP